MYTQCPKCETVFRLSAEALRAAGGQVRCGRCNGIFNALNRLAEEPSAFRASETPLELEARADAILEAGAPPAPPPSPPGADLEASMEFTLPPGELDRIFVDSVETLVLDPVEPMPEHVTGLEVPESVRRDMMAAFAQAATAPGTAPGIAEESGPIAPDGIEQPTAPRRLPPLLWSAATLLLAAVLAAQILTDRRDWIDAHTPYGNVLRALYARLGVTPPESTSLAAYQLRQWGVSADPQANGTLRVRASILNIAAQLQPYPLLRVTLLNRFGARVGTRDFEPSEYLGRPTARLLAPGERADATLAILDPGKDAEGFEIDV